MIYHLYNYLGAVIIVVTIALVEMKLSFETQEENSIIFNLVLISALITIISVNNKYTHKKNNQKNSSKNDERYRELDNLVQEGSKYPKMEIWNDINE
ncbi:chloroquine resistance transporter [Plasmodium falciparum NF54]|uniref:Chloroquine resistance transporter n=1 Tax=Plasmodium falciparum (isolate NF54) TaxID=5843 RepID=W7K959_PLAFO|nr:chloroquine resistance transporter [Plasmodium falciparum NF54]